MKNPRILRIAVIGCGPRGLRACENLFTALTTEEVGEFHVSVFEPHAYPGAGPVYDPSQSDLSLLNVPLRDLHIAESDQAVGSFDSFRRWLDARSHDFTQDTFVPRAILGHYLFERWTSLRNRYSNRLQLFASKVLGCFQIDSLWRLHTSDSTEPNDFVFDAIVVACGHQPSLRDDTLKQVAACETIRVFDSVYPISQFGDFVDLPDSTVVVRGFGLSFLDLMRELTEGRSGKYHDVGNGKLKYERSGEEPKLIIPFDLNRFPPVSQPATAAIDAQFAPRDTERTDYAKELKTLIEELKSETFRQGTATTRVLQLVYAISNQVVRRGTFLTTEQVDAFEKAAGTQLQEVAKGHALGDSSKSSTDAIVRKQIEMAIGKVPPSSDFVLGQIWRHLQDITYTEFSIYPAEHLEHELQVHAGIVKELLEIDSQFKPYSYGPPVIQMQRLLALVESGIVSLAYLDQPTLQAVPNSDRIQIESPHSDSTEFEIFVDAVLSDGSLDQIDSPVLADLNRRRHVSTVLEGGGLFSSDDSLLLLGRVTTGFTIGNDSIHAVFSEAERQCVVSFSQKLIRSSLT